MGRGRERRERARAGGGVRGRGEGGRGGERRVKGEEGRKMARVAEHASSSSAFPN